VKQCSAPGRVLVAASELTSTVICARGSMVETMCRETVGPSAYKSTMRPVVQWSYSVAS
jgi:hypothetical protein